MKVVVDLIICWGSCLCLKGRFSTLLSIPKGSLLSLIRRLTDELVLSFSLATDLTRSASLSEKELKEARVRSQIIAAQLTIPSNSSSRGVQLFNRRKQRVDAFTRKSCGERSDEDKGENAQINPTSINVAWAERSSKGTDKGPHFKNSTTQPHLSHPGTVHLTGTDMAAQGEEFYKGEDMDVIQERHFLPVKEEEDETGNKIHEEFEVKDEIAPARSNADEEVEIKGIDAGPVLPGKVNGCHSASEPETVSVSLSKQTSAIINRTARPFLSPLTVQSPEAVCPIMDIHPPPAYDTPPLPAFTASQPLAFSPPPPPSYPTPPLPAFTNQPPQTYCSSPPPVSPLTSLSSPQAPEFPASILSHFPPMPNYGPPKIQSAAEKRSTTPIKPGILEDGAARRASKKSMFTFKEKPVVSPNPELLMLVQGVDERKKHGHKPVPEPACEEELLALGAEASNFQAKEEAQVEDAKAPEWVSCLRSSRTQPRPEHKLEQTLINVSGKGAELFAKRQSRMEKYILETKQGGQIRSPSPTMSLPPSWVYPSTMPGRVKAIVRNSDVCAQLSQNLQAQKAVQQKPRQKTKAPEPVAEPPPVESGCSKIEMELSSHRPYQIDSSLFILKPVKDPISTLPRGAPQYRTLPTQAFSRQASLPGSSTLNFRTQCSSLQLPLNPARGETAPHPGSGPQRSSSAMSAFPPERASSSQSWVQAPRPTFSATKTGIVPQVWSPPRYRF